MKKTNLARQLDLGSAPAPSGSNPLLQTLDEYIRSTEFKRLINQIAVAQARSDFKSLAVLSEIRGEGKSFFTAALALAYARHLPSRVLIVDTVTPSGREQSCFQPLVGMHVPHSLQSRGLVEPGRIDLVCTNQSSANGAAQSDFQIGQYLSSLADRYDLIIVDTTALAASCKDKTDPLIVAQHVDVSILLASSYSLDKEILSGIKRKLQRYGIEPLGIVFNAGMRK